MIRFLAGIGILVLLLIAGIGLDAMVAQPQRQVAALLEQAAGAPEEQARRMVAQAKSIWEGQRHLAMALAEHGNWEQSEILFDVADRTVGSELPRLCLELAGLCRQCAEERTFSWWNLL